MKWEYAVDTCKDDMGLEELLNSRGQDGWELVSVITNTQPDISEFITLIFKRPNSRQ